jgi:DNA-binding cell septation regulator SpoVG
MKITVERRERDFNVNLHSKEGAEAFLTIKGCRVVEGQKGPFVSWPAKKLDSGKYWNHCWGSDAFNQAVLEAYNAGAPKAAKAPATDDVPF